MSKLKSYNFWIKLVSAIILIARIVLSKFGYELDSALVLDIATLIAGLLVVLGIINEPTGITFSYEEMTANGNLNNNKGDDCMMGKIKTNLVEKVKELNQMIENSNGDMSGVIELLTFMLGEVISGEEEKEEVASLNQDEIIEEESEGEIIVEPMNAGEEKAENQVVIEPIMATEARPEIEEKEVIEEEAEEYAEKESAEDIENDCTAVPSASGQVEGSLEEISDIIKTAESVCEHQFETAYSVAKGNEDAVKMVKEYILSHIDEIVGGV